MKRVGSLVTAAFLAAILAGSTPAGAAAPPTALRREVMAQMDALVGCHIYSLQIAPNLKGHDLAAIVAKLFILTVAGILLQS